SDDEDLAGITSLSSRSQKLRAVSLAQVEVQQHDVHGLRQEFAERLLHGAPRGDNFKFGFGGQQAGDAFAKQSMVIQKSDPDAASRGVSHSRLHRLGELKE